MSGNITKRNVIIIALFLSFSCSVNTPRVVATECQVSQTTRNTVIAKVHHLADRLFIFLHRNPHDRISFYLESIDLSFSQASVCFQAYPNESYKELVYGTNQMTLLVTQLNGLRTIDSDTYTKVLDSFQRQLTRLNSLSIEAAHPVSQNLVQLRSIFQSNYRVAMNILVNKAERFERSYDGKIDNSY